MMQFPGRFLILTCLAVAAVFVRQSSPASASDEPVKVTLYGCHWDVKVDGMIVGFGDVHGQTYKQAKPAALLAATNWAANQDPPLINDTTYVGDPYPEETVLPPGVEPEGATSQRVTSSGQWIVLYRCISRSGKTLETESSGSTFCEAFAESRNFVCENIPNRPFGGACRCCYQVVQRPCCNCGSCCR